MKILLTGAQGQLGMALARSVPEHWICSAANRGELDILRPDAVRAAVSRHRPDVIINAAAYTRVDDAEKDPEAAFAVNADAVATLVDVAREGRARLVHISTDYVFDGQSNRAYCPADPRNPQSAYGRSKAAGEDALGPADLLVRTSWVYAAQGRNFLTTMLRVMREQGKVRVVADQIGAPTWAPRLAEIIWALIARETSGLFHYADAGVASWYDFAVAIAEEGHRAGLLQMRAEVVPISSSDYPTAAYRPPFSLLDSSGTLLAAGAQPTHWRANLVSALHELRQTAEQ